MHAETDRATYWQTLARLTGHSERYLKVRAAARAAVAILPILIPFSAILATK